MSSYKEILNNLQNNHCPYGNETTSVSYSLGKVKMKIKSDGNFQFFHSLEEMARNINKFIKTGY